jgi:hypothetical protein
MATDLRSHADKIGPHRGVVCLWVLLPLPDSESNGDRGAGNDTDADEPADGLAHGGRRARVHLTQGGRRVRVHLTQGGLLVRLYLTHTISPSRRAARWSVCSG